MVVTFCSSPTALALLASQAVSPMEPGRKVCSTTVTRYK